MLSLILNFKLPYGTTSKLANTFRTTTKITLDNFTSAIEGLAINIYEYLNPAINLILKTMTNLIDTFNTITEDSKTLKILFISLGIALMGAFAPISATIIGATILIGGLVRAFQYCYREFALFRVIFDTIGNIIAGEFFYKTDTIKQFENIITNTFKSFSLSIKDGFLNLITLISHGIYELLIYPIKILLTILSKIPKIGKAGQWGLDALKNFEDKTFTYTFNNRGNSNNSSSDNSNGNNNSKTTTDYSTAIAGLGLNRHSDNQNNLLSNNLNTARMGNNMTTTSNKSILDININTPKQYNADYSLNNPYNSGLMINVSGGQS
jgi:hypothetical protein